MYVPAKLWVLDPASNVPLKLDRNIVPSSEEFGFSLTALQQLGDAIYSGQRSSHGDTLPVYVAV